MILAQAHASVRAFNLDDVRFLEAVAHVIAGACDRAASELELRRRALEEPLTGLANRALLNSQLEVELRHARRLDDCVCVLALDLDRFKVVNDTLGHTVGDSLLRRIAARLRTCVREEDLVARPGGDEFTIVCTRTATDHAIVEVAQRLVDVIVAPFEIEGRDVFITASVGVAVSEHGHETPEELLRDADTAMYRAKELGGGRFEAFDVALRHHLIERMTIERDLRHAVQRDQLLLHYQPVIELVGERIVGFEALLRWQHPERGLLAPDQFIHIAEETGLIVPIGSWVLRQVCAQLTQWPDEIRLSANLSALQIRPELVTEVELQLAKHRIAPGRLVLEITESLVLDPSIKPVIASLRALGVQLALDDFGTGYSSLGSLQRFPLDIVKLDRTLIESSHGNQRHRGRSRRRRTRSSVGRERGRRGNRKKNTTRRATRARLPDRPGLPVLRAAARRRRPISPRPSHPNGGLSGRPDPIPVPPPRIDYSHTRIDRICLIRSTGARELRLSPGIVSRSLGYGDSFARRRSARRADRCRQMCDHGEERPADSARVCTSAWAEKAIVSGRRLGTGRRPLAPPDVPATASLRPRSVIAKSKSPRVGRACAGW